VPYHVQIEQAVAAGDTEKHDVKDAEGVAADEDGDVEEGDAVIKED
jgi:hypothetical protein